MIALGESCLKKKSNLNSERPSSNFLNLVPTFAVLQRRPTRWDSVEERRAHLSNEVEAVFGASYGFRPLSVSHRASCVVTFPLPAHRTGRADSPHQMWLATFDALD